MQESYAEGLANHSDRESCIGSRKGSDEALTAECAGWVLSLDNRLIQVPTPLSDVEGNIWLHCYCEMRQNLTWSKTPYMCINSLHGNREIPCLTKEGTAVVRIEIPKGASR